MRRSVDAELAERRGVQARLDLSRLISGPRPSARQQQEQQDQDQQGQEGQEDQQDQDHQGQDQQDEDQQEPFCARDLIVSE